MIHGKFREQLDASACDDISLKPQTCNEMLNVIR